MNLDVFVYSQRAVESRKSEAGPVQLQGEMEKALFMPRWPGIGKSLGLVKASDV